MDVAEVRLNQVLGGQAQYRVPLYQRAYSWGPEQFERLWSDIVDLAEERRSNDQGMHFTGSLVLSLGQVGPGGNEFLVVDGQQRLTTLSVLLCALRDFTKADVANPNREMDAARIHEQFIVDRFRTGDARLKLLPTQADRAAYRAIVDHAESEESSNLVKAYRYFSRKIQEADDPEDPHDIKELETAVLTGLAFVSITARGENVYRIFESLNNTGMRLTQGDLVRNFVFMKLGDRGERIYDSVWRDMQKGLSSDDLADLFWIDLIPATPTARRTAVYALQQQRMHQFTPDEVEAEVHRFARMSRLLKQMRHPDPTTSIGARLMRLREWGNASVEPLVMYVLQAHDRGAASEEQVLNALAVIESYFVRRLLGAAPESGLVRLLLNAVNEVSGSAEAIDQAIRRVLSSGRRYFFTDEQVRTAVRSRPFYFRGRPSQRKLILSWLEQAREHKERVDLTDATVEHVLPQTLNDPWRQMLSSDLQDGETAEQVHEELVHTLGNLTLSAYNTELSNHPFEQKRERYRQSHIELTREIDEHERWTRFEILQRADRLSDEIITLWPGPIAGLVPSVEETPWRLVDQAIAALPPGRWTSYGELAALAGSHPVPVGTHCANADVDGAWRVLQAAGTISPGFHWSDADYVGKNPQALLEEEGLRFDAAHRADPQQKLTAAELANLLGVEFALRDVSGEGSDKETAFIEQLSARQPSELVQSVIELTSVWRDLGGTFRWGHGRHETSCTFAWQGTTANAPIVMYPRGTIEVNFQFLKAYVPFNYLALRDEMRRQLNALAGVRIEPSLLGQRPVVPLELLAQRESRERAAEVLRWFDAAVRADEFSGLRAEETDSRSSSGSSVGASGSYS